MIVNLAEAYALKGQLKHWAYNALDCTGTFEIAEVLLARMDEATERTYAFERAMQAPAMAMMRRGVLVDQNAQADAIRELKAEHLFWGYSQMWVTLRYKDGVVVNRKWVLQLMREHHLIV